MREICKNDHLKFLPCKKVCVPAKNRGKGGVEREKEPKSVGGGQKSGEKPPLCAFHLGPLDGSLPISP